MVVMIKLNKVVGAEMPTESYRELIFG